MKSDLSTSAPRRSTRLFSQNAIMCVVASDYFMLVSLLIVAAFIRFDTPLQQLSEYNDDGAGDALYYPANFFLTAAAIFVFAFWQNGVYRAHNLLRFRSCVRPLLTGLCYGAVACIGVVFFFKVGEKVSRLYMIITPIVIGLGSLCWHWLLTRFFRRPELVHHISERVLFVGWTDEAQKLYEAIRSDAGHPYAVVGYIPSPHHIFQLAPPAELPLLGDYGDLRPVLRRNEIEIVILADLNPNVGEIVSLANECEKEMVQFKIIPSFFRILLSGLELQTISGVPMLGVARLPLDLSINRILKRTLDIVGSLIGLLLFSPVMLLFCVIVYWESPGPVIYRQRRLGRNGGIFHIYKIRSMRLDADSRGDQWATEDDPRKLRIGHFMRRWNIDELPQFWNVLLGNMSLVGPRPEMADLTQLFKEEIPHYNARHSIKPGITGWAQIHGLRGNTDLRERIRYDLYYLENWSIWLDLQILALTFFARKNAY